MTKLKSLRFVAPLIFCFFLTNIIPAQEIVSFYPLKGSPNTVDKVTVIGKNTNFTKWNTKIRLFNDQQNTMHSIDVTALSDTVLEFSLSDITIFCNMVGQCNMHNYFIEVEGDTSIISQTKIHFLSISTLDLQNTTFTQGDSIVTTITSPVAEYTSPDLNLAIYDSKGNELFELPNYTVLNDSVINIHSLLPIHDSIPENVTLKATYSGASISEDIVIKKHRKITSISKSDTLDNINVSIDLSVSNTPLSSDTVYVRFVNLDNPADTLIPNTSTVKNDSTIEVNIMVSVGKWSPQIFSSSVGWINLEYSTSPIFEGKKAAWVLNGSKAYATRGNKKVPLSSISYHYDVRKYGLENSVQSIRAVSKNHQDTLNCSFTVKSATSWSSAYLDSIQVELTDSTSISEYFLEVVLNSGRITTNLVEQFELEVLADDSVLITGSNHNLSSFDISTAQKVNIYGVNFPSSVDSVKLTLDYDGVTLIAVDFTVVDSGNIEANFIIPNDIYQDSPTFEVYIDGEKYSIKNTQLIYFPIGINENGVVPEINLFPNPTNGVVNFSQTANFRVISVSGAVLLHGNGKSVDLSDLPNNMYFIFLEKNMIKVIKQ